MRLAIFDIDGTLTRTNAVDDECFVSAAARFFGVPATEVDWRDAPHITDSGILDWLSARHRNRTPTREELERFQAEFVRLLEQEFAADATRFLPIPGAPEVFTRLAADGWALAMATGAWSRSARLKLAAAGIPVEAVPLITSDDAGVRTMLLRRAMEQAAAGRPAVFERVVSIGDGLWDVRAAVEIGIPFIGIGTGERADLLRAAGATHILPDLADPALLGVALERAGVPRLSA